MRASALSCSVVKLFSKYTWTSQTDRQTDRPRVYAEKEEESEKGYINAYLAELMRQ